jgi:hypothetical protein
MTRGYQRAGFRVTGVDVVARKEYPGEEFPRLEPYAHLTDVLDLDHVLPLSQRAMAGFWSRLQKGNLGRHPGFREAIQDHLTAVERAA